MGSLKGASACLLLIASGYVLFMVSTVLRSATVNTRPAAEDNNRTLETFDSLKLAFSPSEEDVELTGVFVSPRMIFSTEQNPIQLLKTDIVGSDCWSERDNRSLAIHMVVVPFLQYSNTPEEMILAREAEYRHVLEKNLAHPLVQCVHMLTTNYSKTLSKFRDLPNMSKLLIAEIPSVSLTSVPFEYISRNLIGRDAMYTNADIYLGEGFELVDPRAMHEQKIMYALTRRVKSEDRCGVNRMYTDTDKCLELPYGYSHDVFLFRLNETFPDGFLRKLQFKLPSLGMETVLIWLFKNKLGYCVLNPCSVLESFHYHCSNVRSRDLNSKHKVRIDTSRTHVRAPFTKKLKCSET